MKKNKDFYVPPLMIILKEHKFPLIKKSVENVQMLPISEIFKELYHDKMIFFVKKCKPIHDNEFIILYKIFFAETKYLKLFFRFSLKNKFLGIYINDFNRIILPSVSKNHLKDLLINSIKNAYFGIEIEYDYMKFLPLFKSNNKSCVSFKNLTCDYQYDHIGIDFQVEWNSGIMPLQLKGIKNKNLIYQQRIADKHFNLHSSIPLMFTTLGEGYLSRKKRLLELSDNFFAKNYPCVSFI
ncbi:MAG: hypothetical protein WC264_01945 [Candidatus Paceibacterota bacterium]|jgi:hypothetical protein